MSSKNSSDRFGPALDKVEKLLISLELGRARTPDELATLAAEIRRAFLASPELRKMSRPPRSLWKKYVEEVLPLTHLAQHLFSGRQDVRCEPILRDSGNYDAIITFPDGAKTTSLFVEFTCAKDGHEDSLRMEDLNNKGRVNMLGEVTHCGTRNKGRQIEVQDEVVLRSRTLEKHQRLIVNRIKAKARNQYGRDHILVVVFDDDVGFRSEQELADLKSYLALEIDLSALDFRSLYLLGSSGKILSDLQLQG